MVEVRHDKLEPLILRANEIFSRHFHILECDVRRCAQLARPDLDLSTLDPGEMAIDQKHRYATCTGPASPHGRHEVIGEHPIRDPLLLAIDHIMLTICALDRSRSQIPHIRASARLRDRQTDAFPPAQNLRHDLRFQRLGGVLPKRWGTNCQTDEDGRDGAAAVELVPEDEVVEAVPVFGLDAADDGVVLPFFGYGFPAGDGDEESVFGAFLVD